MKEGISVHEDVQEILYSKEAIANRVEELGAMVTEHYRPAVERGEEIVLLCLLRGAAVFMADFARVLDLPVRMEYMSVSSYGNDSKSSGTVTIVQDLSTDIAGKHVIIAEDILDTGRTLNCVIGMLRERGPASVEVVAMLRKDVADQIPIDCLAIGYECPNSFVVGYGLDYAERYRNLPYIGVLKPEIYS